MIGEEVGVIVTTLIALSAGLMRGFTGFGGPAFMVAIMTIFYTPLAILGKILVVDIFASAYLFSTEFKKADWNTIKYLLIPTLITLPLGQWLLIELDPNWMRRTIAIIIILTSFIMLFGFRYKTKLGPFSLIVLGAVSGVVAGATYIALTIVVGILLGPYDKIAARGIIICWAFITAIAYAIVSSIMGTTTFGDVWIALPGAAAYLFGVWLGSRWFREASERLFRNIALSTLLLLSGATFFN